MFTAVDEYTARNRDGVEIQLSSEYVTYRREGRRTRFAYEYLIFEDTLLFYTSSIRAWDTANGGAIITSSERDQVLADLGEALAVLGIKHRVEI